LGCSARPSTTRCKCFTSSIKCRVHPYSAFRPSPAHLLRRRFSSKDESQRSSLLAFKLLGVEYAVQRLKETRRLPAGSRLVCATDGNHGHAVAHVARKYAHPATVYVPGYTVCARIQGIHNEGAKVVVVDEGYDTAVLEAARFAKREGAIVVSDTSWPGYDEIPHWIMAGYTQIMNEAASQWLPDPSPDVVLVQVGVGGLAGAIASWLCHRYGTNRPFLIACEPVGAGCLLESFRAGGPVRLEGSLPTIMAGLRCGQVSMIAWPVLAETVDACFAIKDQYAARAMHLLARPEGDDPVVQAGESGACGLATLLAILKTHSLDPSETRQELGRHREFCFSIPKEQQTRTSMVTS
jgi:diaminopropionate ammonia-lyase